MVAMVAMAGGDYDLAVVAAMGADGTGDPDRDGDPGRDIAGADADLLADIRQQLATLSERVARLERSSPVGVVPADIIAAIRARRGSAVFRASEVLELFPASTSAHAAGLILAKVVGQPLGPDRLVVQRVATEHNRRLWSITQAV